MWVVWRVFECPAVVSCVWRKYAVLLDENNFTADELYTFTYNCCYIYARATRSVSMAPASYYAHLLAARARAFLDGQPPARPPLPALALCSCSYLCGVFRSSVYTHRVVSVPAALLCP